jgi:hypothetical protein
VTIFGRLPDVVAAYKGLIKEKEALEASLQALTASNASAKSYEPGSKPSSNETKNDERNTSSSSISGVEVMK